MKVHIKLFAATAEATGIEELTLEDFTDMAVLQDYLFRQYPALKDLSFIIAHNQEVKQLDFALEDGDEIAILPPFAGG
ncbi:MAG: MoaD/ThiS family protein [Flavobacteriales bacterium]|nr:MoaD/ThiS family protein [Flavobacteriales bacterium]